MRAGLLFLFILFILSCNQGDGVPGNIIEPKRMQELLWDMARADAYLASFVGKNDSLFNRTKETVSFYRQIFQLHKTTREEFNRSREWYDRHPAFMKTILDSLQSRQKNIMEERSKPPTLERIDSIRKSKSKIDLKP